MGAACGTCIGLPAHISLLALHRCHGPLARARAAAAAVPARDGCRRSVLPRGAHRRVPECCHKHCACSSFDRLPGAPAGLPACLPGRKGRMWLVSAFAVCASPRTCCLPVGMCVACRRCGLAASSGASAQRKKQICLACQVLPVERAAPAVAAQQGRPPASACRRCRVQESMGRSGGCCRRGTTSSPARRRCSTWHRLAACCAGRWGPARAQHPRLQPAWHACPQRSAATRDALLLPRAAAALGLARRRADHEARFPTQYSPSAQLSPPAPPPAPHPPARYAHTTQQLLEFPPLRRFMVSLPAAVEAWRERLTLRADFFRTLRRVSSQLF